jgi:hypothetical protein
MDTQTQSVERKPPVFGPPPTQVETQPQRASFDEIVQVKHLRTDGLYVKAYQAPAGLRMYTKRFETDHMTILARGKALLEVQGQQIQLLAPVHFVIPADTRVTVSLLEESVWYCLHPTAETNMQRLQELF